MTIRCKPGDLAIIRYDVPGCESNIGRIVRVRPPAAIDYKGQLTWLITPVTPEPYIVDNPNTGEFRFMEYGERLIEHPHDWMIPIRPEYEEDNENPSEEVTMNKERCHEPS